MASPSQVEIIDNAMFCATEFALAYTDPDQKWLIRKHLISLLNEFPSLYAAIDTFIHNDGATVNLLKVKGDLHISHSLPLIRINIWIHKDYPHVAPIVQVKPDLTNPIHSNHPFVSPSGVTTSSYLQTWGPKYDLLGLANNLVKVFSLDHPFYVVNVPSMSHPSYASRMEAMDHLWWMVHYDMMALRESTNDEIENITRLQDKMRTRFETINHMIRELDLERLELKQRIKEMSDEADILINWLRVNAVNLSVVTGGEVEDAFECVDDDSKSVMEWLAEDEALEDLMYALDVALQKGVMSYETYLKQVRMFARDQFFVRAKIKKLKGTQIFKLLDQFHNSTSTTHNYDV